MGRQAYLTRLALGRSPYGETLRDDEGALILGPHVHDDVAEDYVQQYDEKGKPINTETMAVNRKLQRAQNEVLRVAGVVRKKGDTEQVEPPEKVAKQKEVDIITIENAVGTTYWMVSLAIDSCVQWWVYGVRQRLCTFRSSPDLAFWQRVSAEARAVGAVPFFFAGLPWYATAACVRMLRQRLIGLDNTSRQLLLEPRSRYGPESKSIPLMITIEVLDALYYAFEWPFRAFATLQALQLISPTTTPAFLPWLLQRPTQLFHVSHQLASGNFFGAAIALLSSPYLFACLSEIVRESLVSGIRAVILNCATRPDEPAPISVEGFKKYYKDHEYEGSEALALGRELGIPLRYSRADIAGWGLAMRRRYRGPRTVLASLSFAFPGLFKLLRRVPAIQKRLAPVVNNRRLDQIRATCNQQYTILAHLHSDLDEVEDHMIREEALLHGFRFCGVDAIEAGTVTEEWIEGLIRVVDDENSSTNTPEALSMIDEAPVSSPSQVNSIDRPEPRWGQEIPAALRGDIDEATRTRLLANVAPPPTLLEAELREMMIIPEEIIHEAADPIQLQTLLESANPELATDTTQLLPPTTPTPGIRRARSLPLDLPGAPARRPTEIDETIMTAAEEIRALSPYEADYDTLSELRKYRVTYLSLAPLETLALIASEALTSIIMLPFEIYYTRLLARSYLATNHLRGESRGDGCLVLRDVWPLSPWAGFKEMGLGGSWKFISGAFLTFGMQAILSTVVWRGFAFFVQRQGRAFGWGKF